MLIEHLNITMQANQMKDQMAGKKSAGRAAPPGTGGKPLAGGAPGQMRMSGKGGQGNPVDRVRSGDTGALRGMTGAGG